jgi:antitoxin component of MazEF toxin-antitoxin module
MKVTRVLKVGNGYYINLGHVYAERLNLVRGSLVTVELTERGLFVKPLKIKEEEQDNVQETAKSDL